LVAVQDALRWPAGARRVAGPDLHLTLAFIGAVPQEQLGHFVRAAGITSANIELVLDLLQVWKGATVVLLPSMVPATVADLQGRVVQSLQAEGLPIDERPFAPHVTMARKAKGVDRAAVPPLRWRSEGHVLALSARGRYCAIERFA
jgi:2'-5' RNA ligase